MWICATSVRCLLGGRNQSASEATSRPRTSLTNLVDFMMDFMVLMHLMGINIVRVEMKESLIIAAKKHSRTFTTN